MDANANDAMQMCKRDLCPRVCDARTERAPASVCVCSMFRLEMLCAVKKSPSKIWMLFSYWWHAYMRMMYAQSARYKDQMKWAPNEP